MAGKLLRDWPETARVSASCLASVALLWEWPADRFGVASIVTHLTLGVRLCWSLARPAEPFYFCHSICHNCEILSSGKCIASKHNLIYWRFAEDFTRSVQSFRRAALNPKSPLSLGFRQPGGLFFE